MDKDLEMYNATNEVAPTATAVGTAINGYSSLFHVGNLTRNGSENLAVTVLAGLSSNRDARITWTFTEYTVDLIIICHNIT